MKKITQVSPSPAQPLEGIQNVKHFLAVASGKGGVGKTSVAVNLALALKQQGFHVGLLDADVYGPSIPTMLDLHYQPDASQEMMRPAEKFGIKVMSIGFLIDESQPVIWRGPMVTKAIRQFLGKVSWGELDYLVIDLPPGTGDVSITIAKSLPGADILMVTTPQAVAVADVRRAVSMFRKIGKRVLGIVENMSYFCCEHSDDKIEIFGKGGGEALSRELSLPLLGALPIDIALRKCGDKGVPLMVESPDCDTAQIFTDIAHKLVTSFVGSGEK